MHFSRLDPVRKILFSQPASEIEYKLWHIIGASLFKWVNAVATMGILQFPRPAH